MKRIRSIMLVAILLLSAMAVFAETAAAAQVRFNGTITNAADEGVVGANVQIEKWVWIPTKGRLWRDMGSDTTDGDGFYETPYKSVALKAGKYRMLLNGDVVDERKLLPGHFDNDSCKWTHKDWDYQIPEFATIAIPIVALLGLVAFHRRKQKK